MLALCEGVDMKILVHRNGFSMVGKISVLENTAKTILGTILWHNFVTSLLPGSDIYCCSHMLATNLVFFIKR